MQQTFACPKCGAQNAVGQQFCGACGERLIANCPRCGASVTAGYRFCGSCGAQPDWEMQRGEPLTSAISFWGGRVRLKSRDEVNLWCVDCYGNLCIIVVPRVAFSIVDTNMDRYSERYSITAAIGCIRVNSRSPLLLPAVLPAEKNHQLVMVAATISECRRVPPGLRNIAADMFADTRFVESEDNVPLGIALRRIGKQLGKGEAFTILSGGERAEIYHTCLVADEPKPYSAREMATLKLKGWAHMI